MLLVRQFFALAGLTALEAIRQPICLLLTTACTALCAAVPLSLMHQFGEDGKLARDGALALHFIIGMFVAGHAACSSLSREIRKGTAATVLSKPVGRETLYLAKFAGVGAVVIAFSYCAVLATLMSERIAQKFYYTSELTGYVTDTQTGLFMIAAVILAYAVAGYLNYRTRRPFQSTAFCLMAVFLTGAFLVSGFFDRTGHPAPFDLRVMWRLVPVGVMITMALLVISSVALTLSTRLDLVPTMTITVVVLVVGLVSDYLFGRIADVSAVAGFLYRVLPDWQHFWLPDTLSGNGAIPWKYVVSGGLYALLYSAGMLCLGTALFRHSEIE